MKTRDNKWKDYRIQTKNNINVFDYSLSLNDKFDSLILNLKKTYTKINFNNNELLIFDEFNEPNIIKPLNNDFFYELIQKISSIKKINNNIYNINDLILSSNELDLTIDELSNNSNTILSNKDSSEKNLNSKNKINIAIDGPAGSGKSTVAKLIAKELKYLYINTGLIFRVIALNILNKGIDIKDYRSIKAILKNDSIELFPNEKISLNGLDVSKEVRSDEVSSLASNVAMIPFVRKFALKYQRQFAKNKGIVMDGRDIGTIVLPNAELKIFMWALPEIRAKRRVEQNSTLGFSTNFNKILEEIKRRDKNDIQRKIAPLKEAKDSIRIDTTQKAIDDVVEEVLNLANQKIQ